MRRTLCVIALAAPVMAFSSGSRAQGIDLQTELTRCLGFSGAVERLSCYDRLAHGAVRVAPQSPNPPPARSESPQAVVPRPELGREELPGVAALAMQDHLTAEITDFRKDPSGHFTISLSNGQVWQQVVGDTTTARYQPGRTHSVTISRGTLGSYDLNFNDRNASFKVRRVR